MALRILAALCLAAALSAQSLDESVRAAVAHFQGTVNVFAKDIDTGKTYSFRGDDRVRTASTIKLAVMATIFSTIESGRARWTDEATLHDADKVSGSGVLTEFSDGVRFPVRDLMHLMIVVSDNTATNLLLDRFPADSVNDYMDKLGLKQTRCLRKILNGETASGISRAGRDPANQRFGLGVTTPHEMVLLLEKIERGQVVSPAACREMIAVLKRQQDKDGIGRHMTVPVASKSGALDRLRSGVGIVYLPGHRTAIAITCDDMPNIDWSPDNSGKLMISELSQILTREPIQ